MNTHVLGLLCVATVATLRLLTISAPMVVLGGYGTVGAVDNCRNYQGVWEQTHFSTSNAEGTSMRAAGDTIKLVMKKVADDCSFEATFNGPAVRHSITGTIGNTSSEGSMTMVRTDSNGCTITMWGSMSIIQTPILGVGNVKNLAWKINSNEAGCGVGDTHRETRWFKRVGNSL